MMNINMIIWAIVFEIYTLLAVWMGYMIGIGKIKPSIPSVPLWQYSVTTTKAYEDDYDGMFNDHLPGGKFDEDINENDRIKTV